MCVCVHVCVRLSMQAFFCCADRSREDTGCRPLLLSTLFFQTGFLIKPDVCFFFLFCFFSSSLAGLDQPVSFPMLRLQTHMVWVDGKLKCAVSVYNNPWIFYWRFKLCLSCSKSKCHYLQTFLLIL